MSAGPSRLAKDLRDKSFECSWIARLALPHDKGAPSSLPQGTQLVAISLHILVEFRPPERRVTHWRRRVPAPTMTVPKATVDEHSRTMSRENYIRPSRKILTVEAEPETCGMKRPAHFKFRFGVPASDPRHHATTSRPINNVHSNPESSRY
jgi:hypothetical protein